MNFLFSKQGSPSIFSLSYEFIFASKREGMAKLRLQMTRFFWLKKANKGWLKKQIKGLRKLFHIEQFALQLVMAILIFNFLIGHGSVI